MNLEQAIRECESEKTREFAPRAREWADGEIKKLLAMSPDERRLWLATKPANTKWFNHRRLEWLLKNMPEYRRQFEQLGIRI